MSLISNTEHSLQRKSAIATGNCTDHVGSVLVTPIDSFSLDDTIFNTLEGFLPRLVMRARIAKNIEWSQEQIEQIEQRFALAPRASSIDPTVLEFMLTECDFAMEHADGTFIEHLLFCHDYADAHYSDQSPNILLLHSILGTATNTFAMAANKIPALRELITEEEFRQIQAFPSILRLLTSGTLFDALEQNRQKLDQLKEITFYRVIDNRQCALSATEFWQQLNHQLIHLVDFLPPANWAHHKGDPVFQTFIKLSHFLNECNQRLATVGFQPPDREGFLPFPQQEIMSFGGALSVVIPGWLQRRLAAKAVRKFSANIGHSLDFALIWK